MNSISDRYSDYINPSFIKLLGTLGFGRVYQRAENVWLWDDKNRPYLDALAGFGAVNIGHNHPQILTAIQQLLQQQPMHFCHVGPAAAAADLAEALAQRLPDPLRISLFASSGAEAVEAGLKLARAETGRQAFVACKQGFHGTTLGTLSLMGAARLREPFEPLLANCHSISFGDIRELERVLKTQKPAAFLLEPIQAEGGIVLPPPGYLAHAQQLCRQHGCLLILDEIQTGLGRTGTRFAFEQEGFVPDVLCLAKALSGGMAPISVAITSRDIFDRAYGSARRFDLHSSTYQGNALCCTVAKQTLQIIDDEQLCARAAARGEQLLAGLRQRLADHPLVVDVRGRGLLVGIELGATGSGWLQKVTPALVNKFSESMIGQWIALRLLEAGILAQPCSLRWDVLRLEPPLTINENEIDQLITTVCDILDDYRGLTPVVTDVVQRVGQQWQKGWKIDAL